MEENPRHKAGHDELRVFPALAILMNNDWETSMPEVHVHAVEGRSPAQKTALR